MRKRVLQLCCFLACLTVIPTGFAQEGHPLTGTWTGDWGPNVTERNHLTLIVRWDGDDLVGLMNPGPDSTPIETLSLDATNWTFRFAATAQDADGNPVEVSAQGQLEDIGSAHRSIAGTWRQGTTEGDFRITRD